MKLKPLRGHEKLANVFDKVIFTVILIIYYSFHVSHILSNPDASWEGLKGRIDENILKAFLQGNNFEKSAFLNVASVPVIMNQSQNQGLEKFHAICGPDEFTKTVERYCLMFF